MRATSDCQSGSAARDIASPDAMEFLQTWKEKKSIWDGDFKSAIRFLNDRRLVLCVWNDLVAGAVGTPCGWITRLELTPVGVKLLAAMRTYPVDREIIIAIAHGNGSRELN
jgi:hypothetical protein